MSAIRYFLLTYRRSSGLDSWEDLGTDGALALKKRFELEARFRDDPDVEVVLLSAPSLDALKQTHSRYFKTPVELRADLRASTSS